jgi:hypothetical protein
MEIHGYTETGAIEATIDGVRLTVPDDMANRHRQMVAEWEAAGNTIPAWEPPAPTGADVNAERDRRIAAGFTFDGKLYDFDSRAKANISGAAQLAFMAVVAGAEPGNFRWHGGEVNFDWIAGDNSTVSMDAQTVIAFGRAAAHHEQAHIMIARGLKDMDPIPADYADDTYWVIPPVPDAVPSAPKPVLIGQTRLTIDGLVVSGFGTEAGIASAGIIDDGVLFVEFSAPIDLPYLVWSSDGAGHRVYSDPSEQDEFGFLIRSETESGAPEFPPQIQILITKA